VEGVSRKALFTSSSGVVHEWDDSRQSEGFYQVISSQDVAPLLDHNKAQANHNNGWNADKTLRRAATIPAIVRQKWINEEGWDCFDPANADKLKQKLNCSDWSHLRTAHWRF